ncbi:MAG: hypothetical protein Q4B70_17965 [Lachnospiraceae bacterium]|nr:hypothetical protein [Lachnospiraceae bacterium]
MSKPCFTNEEVSILKKNTYTYSVTPYKISYTLDFKIFVMRQVKAGMTSVKIFKKAGYDPEMLGVSRIYSSVKAIKKEAASPKGLQHPRVNKKEKKRMDAAMAKSQTNKAIEELNDRIEYMQQEIDLLKKTSLMFLETPEEE